MSYTKGPWTADDTSVKCGRDMIASVFDPKDSCHRTAVGMANARLIAAAPDMLEALKRIEPIVDALEYLSPDKAVDGSIAKQIRAAIAKAEGGEAW